MAQQSVEKFVELAIRSRLVSRDQMARALADFRRDVPAERRADSGALAERLIAAGLLSPWQADRLQEGKYKTFFLGKYKLLGHLGAGGMSSVYLAEHTVMNRRVALKVLPKNRVNDTSYLGRFRREAQAAAVLDHRNIVRAYDIDNENDIHYLVMEFIDGRDLHGMVKSEGPLDFALAADYIAQAAEGLQHAHEAGLVHRDVKPANLLIDSRGTIKVSDLGLARFDDAEAASLTMEHNENVLGTADYVAPEQALDSHKADSRADIYSLGCTLYYLLTGHPPFPDGSLSQRLLLHQTQEPPDILLDRPDAPSELLAICRRMMLKSAADRYQSMAEVAEALRDWLYSIGYSRSLSESGSIPKLPALRKSSAGGSPGTGPGSDKQALSDTVSNHDKDSVKSSSSKIARSKGLPVAKPLASNPYQDLEAVIAPGRSPSRSGVGRARDASAARDSGKLAVPGKERSAAAKPGPRPSGELPKWFWPALAGGAALAVLFFVLMLMRSP